MRATNVQGVSNHVLALLKICKKCQLQLQNTIDMLNAAIFKDYLSNKYDYEFFT